ncbi:sulfurtransferase complex subunit TusD [Marinobacter sp.]|uniref:sulfurtransferase complex subunit TusD n=1 Tax=Marinobacter sp. TaxID=50741 RepID=UPI0035666B24
MPDVSTNRKPGYSLVITGAPYISQAPATAFDFCKTLLETGHKVDLVFLYGDGVQLASVLTAPPSDETNWTAQWQALGKEHRITPVACIASALRRGLLNEEEARRYEKPAANLAEGFTIAGLGEWVEAVTRSDRVVYFHGGA